MRDSVLWYRAPATRWTEALPVGNGQLGAMLFGGVADERSSPDEDSLSTGSTEDADNPEALVALARIWQRSLRGNTCDIRHGDEHARLATVAGNEYDLSAEPCK